MNASGLKCTTNIPQIKRKTGPTAARRMLVEEGAARRTRDAASNKCTEGMMLTLRKRKMSKKNDFRDEKCTAMEDTLFRLTHVRADERKSSDDAATKRAVSVPSKCDQQMLVTEGSQNAALFVRIAGHGTKVTTEPAPSYNPSPGNPPPFSDDRPSDETISDHSHHNHIGNIVTPAKGLENK